MIGEDKVVQFKGCAQGEACSIVLRGSSGHVLAEARRSLHDALAVIYATVQETRVCFGGGCMEMIMGKAVLEEAAKTEGKHSVAMEDFAKALMKIPEILADKGELGIMESYKSKTSSLCAAAEAAEQVI